MGWELDRTWCEGLHFDVLAETSGNESENGSQESYKRDQKWPNP